MTAIDTAPISGYFIEKIYTNLQELRVQRPEGEPKENDFSILWDWQIVSDRMFDVSLRIALSPTSERWESVKVKLVGRFRVGDHPLSVSLEDFVKLQAPAILLPYAREIISAMTSHGFYGPYYLPAVNVVRLMATMDPDAATGKQQLAEGKTFALPPVEAPPTKKKRLGTGTTATKKVSAPKSKE